MKHHLTTWVTWATCLILVLRISWAMCHRPCLSDRIGVDLLSWAETALPRLLSAAEGGKAVGPEHTWGVNILKHDVYRVHSFSHSESHRLTCVYTN